MRSAQQQRINLLTKKTYQTQVKMNEWRKSFNPQKLKTDEISRDEILKRAFNEAKEKEIKNETR